ncbi:hypothetical protein B0H13DRAFT_1863922 [Mycena leptocephala]|nr:hypothetical protein B0H13DRAFT_1863922 [Mycena leptocephala]
MIQKYNILIVFGSARINRDVVEELSSALVDSNVGRESGIWGARVKQKVNEWSQKWHEGVEWKSSENRGMCRVGVRYGCKTKRLGEGDILVLSWKVFTGGALALEYSSHWPRRRWWFVGEKVIFGNRKKFDFGGVPGIEIYEVKICSGLFCPPVLTSGLNEKGLETG